MLAQPNTTSAKTLLELDLIWKRLTQPTYIYSPMYVRSIPNTSTAKQNKTTITTTGSHCNQTATKNNNNLTKKNTTQTNNTTAQSQQ